MSLLEVSNLSIEYAGVAGDINHAVNELSYHLDPGEVVGIVGESGSGKSTATLAVLGLTRHGGRITGGSVKLEGRELLGLSQADWRRVRGADIGLVTQNPRGALNPVSRVGEQVCGVYRAHRDVSAAEARERALELLRMVGINDPERRLAAFPHELSGGMAQRVVIAMALACTPKLLIADEPTSGLDVTVQAQLLDDLRDAATEAGSSLLLVTQDLGVVANYCDRVYLVHAGEAVEISTAERFFAEPANPATLALMAAHRADANDALKLRGFPVDGRRLPAGCWLNPRCPFADDAAGCRSEHPALRETAPGHWVRCHRSAEVAKAARAYLAAIDHALDAPAPSPRAAAPGAER